MLRVLIIIGSTREGRFSEKPAAWIWQQAKMRSDFEAELLDLRDYPLPFYDQPVSPARATEPFANEMVQRWTTKVAEADGYIIVTPEYNHGYPAVLKNALDWVYGPWNRKPVGFVSYGSALGARGVEQLRLVAVELQMAPIRASIFVPSQVYQAATNFKEGGPDPFASLNERATMMFDQLVWWAQALKTARMIDKQ